MEREDAERRILREKLRRRLCFEPHVGDKIITLLGPSMQSAADPRAVHDALTSCARLLKLCWALHKPLDLLGHFYSPAGEVLPEVAAVLQARLCQDDLTLVTAALTGLHLRALPKVGLGTATLHLDMADQQPCKLAFDLGYRFFDFFDPDPVFQGTGTNDLQVAPHSHSR